MALINIDDLYVLLGSEGMYESYNSYKSVIIGKENAESAFRKWISETPIDEEGDVALYKAKLDNNYISPDYEQELTHMVFNYETMQWEEEE